MVTESEPPAKQARYEDLYIRSGLKDFGETRIKKEPSMDSGYAAAMNIPDDKVTSAADAMLKLSNSSPPPRPIYVLNPGGIPPPNSTQGMQGFQQGQPIGIPQTQVTTSNHINMKADIKPILPGNQKIIRRQREFIPEFKKDEQYWSKRRKNNEAAKRSREKRRMNDVVMCQKIQELTAENTKVRQELESIKRKFGLPIDKAFPIDEISAQSVYYESENSTELPCHISNGPLGAHSEIKTEMISPNHSPVKVSTLQQQQQGAGPQRLTVPAFPTGGHMTVHQQAPAGSVPVLVPITRAHHEPPMAATLTSKQTPPAPQTQPVALLTTRPAAVSNQPQLPLKSYTQQYANLSKGLPLTTTLPPSPPLHGIRAQPITTLERPEVYKRHANAHSFLNGEDSPLKVPDVCPPHISSDDSSNSPHSLTIAISGGSSSNDNSGDEGCDGPLNLATTSHHGGGENSRESSPSSFGQSVAGRRKGIPHKLRHKYSVISEKLLTCSTPTDSQKAPVQSGASGHTVPEHTEVNEDSDSDMSLSSSFSSSSAQALDGDIPSDRPRDVKYFERRKRNNMAARKCRENRKVLNQIRISKSAVLETENTRLKEELTSLSAEVNNLKQMIEKKQEAKARGEPFSLPAAQTTTPTNGTGAAI